VPVAPQPKRQLTHAVLAQFGGALEQGMRQLAAVLLAQRN